MPARFLPRSRTHLRLLEIEADPAAVYLPKQLGNGKVYAGPAGLPEPLAELFRFSAPQHHGPSASKRPRTGTVTIDDDLSVELGRRGEPGSDRFSLGLGNQSSQDDWDPNAFQEYGGGGEISGGFEQPLDFSPIRAKSATPAPLGSRGITPIPSDLWSTPGPKRTPGEGALGVFDVAPSTEASQRTASQVEEKQAASSGWSKNTVRALKVLGDELGAEDADGPKSLSFETLSEKVRIFFFLFRMSLWADRGGVGVQAGCCGLLL